ncbi:MAG: tetratricopeptide repeat protein [Myxococcales bacterium]|nr:tetratricopeptide repeat protein [Myxococcales bacterium]
MRALLASVALVAAVATGAPNPKIGEARKQFEDLDFEKAARTLAAAEGTPGNDREQVLEILQLQGIVFGTMNKEAKARDAFRELLTLSPDFKLEGNHPPRVRTPFYEAKEWVDTNLPLQLEPRAMFDVSVTALTVLVKKDMLRLAKGARFLIDEGPEPRSRDTAFVGGVAKVELDAPKVAWRVQVLGAKDSVLLELGPFTHQGGAAPAVATTTAPGVEPGKPLAGAATTSASEGSWMRPASYGVLGAGALALVVGSIFGVMANEARAKVTGAMTNEAGLITSVSQRDAAGFEARMKQQGTIANVLFGVGGGLLAAGAVLFFVGAPASGGTQVSLHLSPSGFAVMGMFP